MAFVNGEVTTDPAVYHRVRNTPAILALKAVSNTAAAIGWALVIPALRRSTPDWMWVWLIVWTFAGIMTGPLLQRHRALANRPR